MQSSRLTQEPVLLSLGSRCPQPDSKQQVSMARRACPGCSLPRDSATMQGEKAMEDAVAAHKAELDGVAAKHAEAMATKDAATARSRLDRTRYCFTLL